MTFTLLGIRFCMNVSQLLTYTLDSVYRESYSYSRNKGVTGNFNAPN